MYKVELNNSLPNVRSKVLASSAVLVKSKKGEGFGQVSGQRRGDLDPARPRMRHDQLAGRSTLAKGTQKFKLTNSAKREAWVC